MGARERADFCGLIKTCRITSADGCAILWDSKNQGFRISDRRQETMIDQMRVDRSAPTLRELTLEKLRDAISQGFYRPGDRLIERTLCDQLGVSRTVVREVLRHLETEGLVETVAHSGPIVARLDPAQGPETYAIRALLESGAARSCAANSTPAPEW